MPYIGNIVQDFSVNNAMLNTDSVTSIKIDDGTIVNADINASAAIAGSKIDGSSFASITSSGSIVISQDNAIHFNTTNGNDFDAILRENSGNVLLINSRNDAILNIDSNNDSTDAHFAVAHGAATSSSTELFRVQENGNVGIGTTSPIAKLNVNSGTTDLAAQLVSSDANVFLAFKDGDASGNQQVQIGGEGNNLVAYAGGSERMRIDSSGQVGIGVTPDTWSTGAGITVGTSQGTLWGSGDQINLSGNAYFNSGWKAAASKAGASQIEQALGNIDFKVSGSVTADSAITFTNAMRINSSGNVGIGTTSPTGFIHIAGSSNGTETYGRFSTGLANGDQNLYIQSGSSRDHMALQVKTGAGANDDLSLNPSGGNVGIGTTSPNYELQVNDPSGTISVLQLTNTTTGTGAGDGLLMYITGNDTIISNEEAGYMRFQTSGLERMRIDSSGQIYARSNSLQYLILGSSGQATSGGPNNDQNWIRSNGNNLNLNCAASGFMSIETNGSERMRIDSSGRVGINTTSPAHKLDLDNGSVRFNRGNSAGEILLLRGLNANQFRFDTDGLKFGSDTAAANALHDYEEGEWTPVGNISGVGGVTLHSPNRCRYTRVGRIVHITARFTPSGSSGSSNLMIGGLPFNSGGSNASAFCIMHNGFDEGGSQEPVLMGFVGGSTANISFYYTRTNGAGWNTVIGTEAVGHEIIFEFSYYTDS